MFKVSWRLQELKEKARGDASKSPKKKLTKEERIEKESKEEAKRESDENDEETEKEKKKKVNFRGSPSLLNIIRI